MQRVQLNIRKWYDEVVATLGQDALPPYEEIHCYKQPGMTGDTLARAFPKTFERQGAIVFHDYYQITVSAEHFTAYKQWMSPEQFSATLRATIIHELLHISCFKNYRRRVGHGVEWQQLMLKMGLRY